MPKIERKKDDESKSQTGLAERIQRLQGLIERITVIPESWLAGAKKSSQSKSTESTGKKLDCIPCSDYQTLITSWKKAMRWRQCMDDVLCTMLSVVISTMQVGDQLFLQVIGDAGGGKTRFCDALLVSDYCYPLEHLTGFHSGWKSEDGEDHSLLARINGKTLITPEADVIMSGSHFAEIMSQQRRIFDGTSGASYKNMKEDRRYTGLRTPWIMAGTPALMDGDQSRLGDRFLKVFIDSPDADEKKDILRRVGYTALRSVVQTSNSDAGKQIDPKLAQAYGLTGGYCNYLRENAEELLSQLSIDEEWLVDRCSLLGEFTADLRARPDPDKNKDSIPTKEMPTRLTHQFVRMACCMAVVLNKKTVDEEVIRRTRKLAIDTSYGVTIDLASHMFHSPNEGFDIKELAIAINRPDERTRHIMRFLYAIDVAETFRPDSKHGGVHPKPKWRLTQRFRDVFEGVMG